MVFFVLVPALPEELFDNAVVTLTLDLTSRRWLCSAFGAEGLGWRGAGVEGFRGLGFRGLRFKHFAGRSSQLARMNSPFLQKGLSILLLKLSVFIYCICIIIAPPNPVLIIKAPIMSKDLPWPLRRAEHLAPALHHLELQRGIGDPSCVRSPPETPNPQTPKPPNLQPHFRSPKPPVARTFTEASRWLPGESGSWSPCARASRGLP